MQPDTPRDPAALEAALAARTRQIDAVHSITGRLSYTLDIDDRLREILAVCLDAADAVGGSIMLFRPSDGMLVFQYVVGPAARDLTGFAMPANEGVCGRVFTTGESEVTNRPRETPGFRADVGDSIGLPSVSILTVPLKHQDGKAVGVVQLINKREGEFGPDDLEVLEIIAGVAATAIETARLHRDAQIAAVAHAVGDLSHDIKNKVTPISLSVDTLWPIIDDLYHDLDRAATELPDAYREQIVQATDVLRGLYAEMFAIIKDQVKEIQDHTKLIADALRGSIAEPQLEPHDLGEIVRDQLRLLEPAAQAHRVKVTADCDVPTCRFDRFLIERAVFNLVNNAIPETPPGGSIMVRACAHPTGEFPAGANLVIEVIDTGRGMPAHVLRRALRGEAKSTKPGGTGLGTRIVFNAVTAHHGRFEGESEEGVGTTFRLILPFLAP